MSYEKDGWDVPEKNTPNPETQSRVLVPAEAQLGQYPLIDNDPHLSRVVRYARTSDWLKGLGWAAAFPGAVLLWEKVSPTYNTRGSVMRIARLAGGIGIGVGFCSLAMNSSLRFYGHSENAREVELDMREMTDRAKKGQPLYALFLFAFPIFNIVNHPHHGVDTAKYYQNAERELEDERIRREGI